MKPVAGSAMNTLPSVSAAMLAGSCSWPGPSPWEPHSPMYSSASPTGFCCSACVSVCPGPAVERMQIKISKAPKNEMRFSIWTNLAQLKIYADQMKRGGASGLTLAFTRLRLAGFTHAANDRLPHYVGPLFRSLAAQILKLESHFATRRGGLDYFDRKFPANIAFYERRFVALLLLAPGVHAEKRKIARLAFGSVRPD